MIWLIHIFTNYYYLVLLSQILFTEVNVFQTSLKNTYPSKLITKIDQ